jgi:ABC-type multidrug transport system fused ATPase/permease subunit
MNILFEKLGYNYIKQNITLVIAYFIAVFFTFPLESVLLPRLYGNLFEKVKKSDSNNKFDNFDIYNNIKKFNIPGILSLITLTWLTATLGHSAKHSIESKLIPDFLSFIRNKIFTSVIENKSSNYSDVKSGDLITRIMDLSRFMKQLFQWIITKFLPETIGLITVIIYSYFIHIHIGLILTIGITLLCCVGYFGGKYVINYSKEREKGYYKMCEKMNDNFNNLMNIFLNNQDNNETKKNKHMNDHHGSKLKTQMEIEKNAVLLMQIIVIATYTFALFYGYTLFKSNKLKMSIFISLVLILGNFLSYLLTLNHSILSHICGTYGNVMASEEFLTNILQKNKTKNQKDFINKGDIEFENIDFKYNNKKYIFKDFSLKIKGSSKTAIVGQSGSGKSSLMRMLVLINKPDKGKIKIDGVNILDCDTKYLRNEISYVNQRTNLFNKSVIDNIIYGNNVSKQQVLSILKKYDLLKVYNKLNNGIESSAGVNGNNLSGGMQKVTILLRGILKSSKIIIFDEPLAGLDSTTRASVMKMINQECRYKTVVVITHDKEILTYMDQVINLNRFKQI